MTLLTSTKSGHPFSKHAGHDVMESEPPQHVQPGWIPCCFFSCIYYDWRCPPRPKVKTFFSKQVSRNMMPWTQAHLPMHIVAGCCRSVVVVFSFSLIQGSREHAELASAHCEVTQPVHSLFESGCLFVMKLFSFGTGGPSWSPG